MTCFEFSKYVNDLFLIISLSHALSKQWLKFKEDVNATTKNIKMSSFKSRKNIQKKEGGPSFH